MKTWEMIKELTENPDKEFISYMKKGFGDVLKTQSIKGAIRFSNEEDNWHEVLIGVDLDREWEEIKKPVDFMTALKSRKFVKVEHELATYTDYERIDLVLVDLADNLYPYGFAEVIENGKWYIQD